MIGITLRTGAVRLLRSGGYCKDDGVRLGYEEDGALGRRARLSKPAAPHSTSMVLVDQQVKTDAHRKRKLLMHVCAMVLGW